MSRVWPGVVVEENTLQFHISALRKALGPDRDFTKNISGRAIVSFPAQLAHGLSARTSAAGPSGNELKVELPTEWEGSRERFNGGSSVAAARAN